jgi:hypothetical protein
MELSIHPSPSCRPVLLQLLLLLVIVVVVVVVVGRV